MSYNTVINGNQHLVDDSFRYLVKTDNYTVVPQDNGKIIAIGTDAKTMTLPLASTVPGMLITFLNIGAAGNNIITISPNAADAIKGNLVKSQGSNADATTADGLVAISGGVANKDWVNTKATANIGDRTTLMSDGSTTWWILDGVGIWASEG
jgi:hypothetical protein